MENKKEDMNEPKLLDELKNSKLAKKSDSLAFLQESQLTLVEWKVLCAYISQVNIENKSTRMVTFTRKEYEQLMGLQKANLQTLRKSVHSLQIKTIPYKMENGQIVNVSLFQISEMSVNEYGEAIITLECTERAQKLLFDNMKQYKKYKLKFASSLTSRYAMALYFYIQQNSSVDSWTISVENLKRDVFHIDNVETYNEFKYFNERILKKAVEDINAHTDCHIEYELNKKGRYVVAITIHPILNHPILNFNTIHNR